MGGGTLARFVPAFSESTWAFEKLARRLFPMKSRFSAGLLPTAIPKNAAGS
jgi:hypothetical protein